MMNDKLSTSDIMIFLAATEFLIIIVIALVAFFFIMSRKKKSDANATTNLANKIKSKKVERKSELSSVLSETYNIEGKDLKKETEKLIKLENQFYQRFIKTYLTRDANAVEMIDEDLKELLMNYNQLVPKHDQRDERAEEALAVIDSLSDDKAENEAQAERLKETINNLSDDLKQYKNTINRLFFEYSAMFGVDVDPRNQLSATEILSRLETGRLGDEEPSLKDLDDNESDTSVEYFDDSVDVDSDEEAVETTDEDNSLPDKEPDEAPSVEHPEMPATSSQNEPATTNETGQPQSAHEAPPAQPLPDDLIAELLGEDIEIPPAEKPATPQQKQTPEQPEAENNEDATPKSELEQEEDEFEKEFAALVAKKEE